MLGCSPVKLLIEMFYKKIIIKKKTLVSFLVSLGEISHWANKKGRTKEFLGKNTQKSPYFEEKHF
jgi:hypothetical protein